MPPETDPTESTVESATVDVCIVGAGPAGLTAGIFTARAGLETLVVSAGEPILRRNAHLENFPGFPAGVNARLLLDMMVDQADRNGCEQQKATVTNVTESDDGFLIDTASGDTVLASFVICTSWSDTTYLDEFDDVGVINRGSKTYVDVEDDGSTGVDGLYAAGRIAGKPHQSIVAAGHGAEVALTVIHDSDIPFYHDWVVPENYFTGRGRDVPPGCEEIDDEERARRERKSIEVMQEYFSECHPDDPTQHPSVGDSE